MTNEKSLSAQKALYHHIIDNYVPQTFMLSVERGSYFVDVEEELLDQIMTAEKKESWEDHCFGIMLNIAQTHCKCDSEANKVAEFTGDLMRSLLISNIRENG